MSREGLRPSHGSGDGTETLKHKEDVLRGCRLEATLVLCHPRICKPRLVALCGALLGDHKAHTLLGFLGGGGVPGPEW